MNIAPFSTGRVDSDCNAQDSATMCVPGRTMFLLTMGARSQYLDRGPLRRKRRSAIDRAGGSTDLFDDIARPDDPAHAPARIAEILG